MKRNAQQWPAGQPPHSLLTADLQPEHFERQPSVRYATRHLRIEQ